MVKVIRSLTFELERNIQKNKTYATTTLCRCDSLKNSE